MPPEPAPERMVVPSLARRGLQGLVDLPDAQRAPRQIRGQAAAGRAAGFRLADVPLVGVHPPFVEERPQILVPRTFAPRLKRARPNKVVGMGDRGRRSAPPSLGPLPRWRLTRLDVLQCFEVWMRQRTRHVHVPCSHPPPSVGASTLHPELRFFKPRHPIARAPSRHRLVAVEGPRHPCFLVRVQGLDGGLGVQTVQDVQHRGMQPHEGHRPRLLVKGACQVFQTLPLELDMAGRGGGVAQQSRLEDMEHHDPVAVGSRLLHGPGQRRVVPRSEVTLEPHDMHPSRHDSA